MTNHLNALQLRLSNERSRLALAKTEQERALRRVWIVQVKKEIAREKHGSYFDAIEADDMTDDELLAALGE
jgi:hypothetical protein